MYSLDSVMLEFDFLRTGETSVSDTVAGSGIGLDTWFPSALLDLVAAFPFLSSFVETPTAETERGFFQCTVSRTSPDRPEAVQFHE